MILLSFAILGCPILAGPDNDISCQDEYLADLARNHSEGPQSPIEAVNALASERGIPALHAAVELGFVSLAQDHTRAFCRSFAPVGIDRLDRTSGCLIHCKQWHDTSGTEPTQMTIPSN